MAAIRSLEERVMLLRQFAGHLESHNCGGEAEALLSKVQAARDRANEIRRVIISDDTD